MLQDVIYIIATFTHCSSCLLAFLHLLAGFLHHLGKHLGVAVAQNRDEIVLHRFAGLR